MSVIIDRRDTRSRRRPGEPLVGCLARRNCHTQINRRADFKPISPLGILINKLNAFNRDKFPFLTDIIRERRSSSSLAFREAETRGGALCLVSDTTESTRLGEPCEYRRHHDKPQMSFIISLHHLRSAIQFLVADNSVARQYRHIRRIKLNLRRHDKVYENTCGSTGYCQLTICETRAPII